MRPHNRRKIKRGLIEWSGVIIVFIIMGALTLYWSHR